MKATELARKKQLGILHEIPTRPRATREVRAQDAPGLPKCLPTESECIVRPGRGDGILCGLGLGDHKGGPAQQQRQRGWSGGRETPYKVRDPSCLESRSGNLVRA